jgi:hypothetical protein
VVIVDSLPDLLNLEQRKLYNTMVGQYTQELTYTTFGNPPLSQLLLNVDGVAKSRKTFTLLKTCARIQELAL